LVLAAVVLVGLAIALLVMTRTHEVPVATHVDDAAPAPRVAQPQPPRPPPPAIVAADAGTDPAQVEREQLLARIRDPLHGHEGWNDRGIALLQQLGADARTTTELGCYMAGCIAVFTFASADAYQRAHDRLVASADYAAWTGAKKLTTPEERGDGSVVVAVAFERPD
jgi:hypothetical protein